MFSKIRTFWSNFWYAIKSAYNTAFKNLPGGNVQAFSDTSRINFLAIFTSKLNNLSNIESTYEIEGDSTRVEPLKRLCSDLEAKRFDITEKMLGEGDYWVFPSHNSIGELYHRYVACDKVRILNMDGEDITEIVGIIDEYVSNNGETFFLKRHHTLDGDVLFIKIEVTNERNEPVYFAEWQSLEGEYQFIGAHNIGVGRFKSPVSGRGKEPVYGVPLNFGCGEIESKIFEDLAIIEKEFKNAESKIFADPLIMRKAKEKRTTPTIDKKYPESVEVSERWSIPENVFPIDTRGGTASAHIDIFSPEIRYSQYRDKLIDDMKQYEQQVGTDRGFLTPFENGTSATATEIRRSNASTIAMVDRIHTAQKNGVESTLNADAIFLNIPGELYTVKYDFYDAFEDVDKQYERISSAVDRGILEKDDELQWLFPEMTPEERAEKLSRISQEAKSDSEQTIERILNGGE